jgi:hypothetical protein
MNRKEHIASAEKILDDVETGLRNSEGSRNTADRLQIWLGTNQLRIDIAQTHLMVAEAQRPTGKDL